MTQQLKLWWEILELANADWFPLNSRHDITQKIENGQLQAINVGTKKYKRYKIHRDKALDFIINHYDKQL